MTYINCKKKRRKKRHINYKVLEYIENMGGQTYNERSSKYSTSLLYFIDIIECKKKLIDFVSK